MEVGNNFNHKIAYLNNTQIMEYSATTNKNHVMWTDMRRRSWYFVKNKLCDSLYNTICVHIYIYCVCVCVICIEKVQPLLI